MTLRGRRRPGLRDLPLRVRWTLFNEARTRAGLSDWTLAQFRAMETEHDTAMARGEVTAQDEDGDIVQSCALCCEVWTDPFLRWWNCGWPGLGCACAPWPF